MFENLDIFRMSADMARHAGQRQAVVAQNVANADTPGYIARDLPDFASSYGADSGATTLRATRASHLHGVQAGELPRAVNSPGAGSPNGNQVSVESELLNAVDAKRQHDRALAIYKSALTVLRSTMRV